MGSRASPMSPAVTSHTPQLLPLPRFCPTSTITYKAARPATYSSLFLPVLALASLGVQD